MQIMLFLVPTFFLVFSMCALYDNVLSSVMPRYTGRWLVQTVPADVELFATFVIPQISPVNLHCK